MAWYTLNLARGLRASGHDVYLSSQKGSPLAKWALNDGLQGDSERNFHSGNPAEVLMSLNKLRQVIATFQPDILNPHCPPGHALLALLNRGKTPLIRTVAEPRQPKAHFINRYLHEQKTDGMIYSTASSFPRYANAFTFSKTQETVILPGLDVTLFPPARSEGWRARLQIPEGALFAAIVARMNPEKGQELLVEALTLLSEQDRANVVVLLTGDDNQQRTAADLKMIADKNGVVESLRFQPRLADVRPLLSEIDLGIITSVRSEAVCRIALEYMAYGKPILSTDVNILSEVVRHGENGWIVPITDARLMADALAEAIHDRPRLRELGARGKQLLESQMTLQKMTLDTIAYYKSVADNRG